VLVASMLVGLADEQLNPSNPRVYDYRGAMQWVRAHASADDELVYAPEYLYDALRYYRPGMAMRSTTDGPLPEPTPQRHVFIVGSFVEYPSIAGPLRGVLGEFNHTGRLVAHRHYPNVEIWEFA
jgi:hypothetical protein